MNKYKNFLNEVSCNNLNILLQDKVDLNLSHQDGKVKVGTQNYEIVIGRMVTGVEKWKE